MEHSNGSGKPSTDQSESPHPQSSAMTATSEGWSSKRKLYAIDECEESSPVAVGKVETDLAYDADVDELEQPTAKREIIYELFQPWALSTYGDQAKTKTITLRKKARILKALEGKEHSRPDSSKFRFWVKTKGFTTNRPEGFEEAPGSRRCLKSLPSSAILSDNPGDVDLFAASTSKGFGRRTYRKVACVEEFFDIIYNVHMELGGRSGMHAGQKRTYRIITETYAFLPREAVTRFLTICPECKKNLRPSSPSGGGKDSDLAGNESSSEVENYLNYSSHTETSLEAGPTAKRRRHSSAEIKALMASSSLAVGAGVASSSSATQLDVLWTGLPQSRSPKPPLTAEVAVETTSVSVPKIRIKLQRPSSPLDQSPAYPNTSPQTQTQTQGQAQAEAQAQSQAYSQSQSQSQAQFNSQPSGQCLDAQLLKSRDNLLRYYHFMRRFYAGEPVLAPPIYGSSLLQSLSYPTTISTAATATPTTPTTTTSFPGKMLAPPKAATPPPNPPKIKTSPDSLLRARTPPVASTATSAAPKDTAHTPINLTKSIFSSLKTGHPPCTSTPVPLKLELPSPPKPLPELRIPQLRGMPPVELSLPLPPLDLERLKPITSTYLQLTRSMGLSDEDALRFDNLVSKDFKYSL